MSVGLDVWNVKQVPAHVSASAALSNIQYTRRQISSLLQLYRIPQLGKNARDEQQAKSFKLRGASHGSHRIVIDMGHDSAGACNLSTAEHTPLTIPWEESTVSAMDVRPY